MFNERGGKFLKPSSSDERIPLTSDTFPQWLKQKKEQWQSGRKKRRLSFVFQMFNERGGKFLKLTPNARAQYREVDAKVDFES